MQSDKLGFESATVVSNDPFMDCGVQHLLSTARVGHATSASVVEPDRWTQTVCLPLAGTVQIDERLRVRLLGRMAQPHPHDQWRMGHRGFFLQPGYL